MVAKKDNRTTREVFSGIIYDDEGNRIDISRYRKRAKWLSIHPRNWFRTAKQHRNSAAEKASMSW